MIRSFNDKPRPIYEAGPMDMADDIITFFEADQSWLETEINYMKLVMKTACSEIEDEDYLSAIKVLRHAIERPL